jgi:hypothetical protein
MIAHVGAVPLEELLPAVTGLSSALLATRTWTRMRVGRRGGPRA